jgi:hypothetical protein
MYYLGNKRNELKYLNNVIDDIYNYDTIQPALTQPALTFGWFHSPLFYTLPFYQPCIYPC